MKKSIMLMCIAFIVVLASCGNNNENGQVNTPVNTRKSVTQVETFGNQVNSEDMGQFFFNADMIYYVFNSKGIKQMSIEDKITREILYDDSLSEITQIKKIDNWIYYVADEYAGEYSTTSILYRIDIDGTNKTKLAENVDLFLLSKEGVYYSKYETSNNSGSDSLAGNYVMNLDGTQKQKTLDASDLLVGIDSGWIYYNHYMDSDELYRMTPDGKKSENVFDIYNIKNENVDNYLVDGAQIFFEHNDNNKNSLKSVSMDGEEKILLDDVGNVGCINKDGNWLFFSEDQRVFKIDLNNTKNKILVYNNDEEDEDGDGDSLEIESIIVDAGNVLLTTEWQIICIGKKGSITYFDFDS